MYPCYTEPVANLTLVLDDTVLKRARIRAIEEGTSVNAVVRSFLEDYAGRDAAHAAMMRILELTREAHASSGAGGRTWTREELYDR